MEALIVDERGCPVLEDSGTRRRISEITKSTIKGTPSKNRNLHNSQNKNFRGLPNDVSFKVTSQADGNSKCSTSPKKVQFADNVLQYTTVRTPCGTEEANLRSFTLFPKHCLLIITTCPVCPLQ